MGIDNVMIDKVTVLLDKEREIRFSMKSFAMLAKKYGSVKNALEGFSNVDGMQSFSEETIDLILDLACAGLCHDKTIDRDGISEAITLGNFVSLVMALKNGLNLYLPKSEDDTNPPRAV